MAPQISRSESQEPVNSALYNKRDLEEVIKSKLLR